MSDLDNFFAKKDRKKKKSKKFTPEEVVKKLEEAEKKQCERDKREELKRKQERDQQLENVYPWTAKSEPAEEWHENVEEAIDVSDLNIHQLELPDQSSSQSHNEQNGDSHNSRHVPGPWSKVKSSSASDSDESSGNKDSNDCKQDSTDASSSVVPGTASASASTAASSVYVAPHRMRGSTALPSLAARRRGGAGAGREMAPDINSDEAFPTLAAATPEAAAAIAHEREEIRCGGAFHQVRHGGQVTSQDARFASSKVAIGNQFEGLRLNDAS